MAKLKGLRVKSKTFIFKSYENDKEELPAKIVFCRFPQGFETFYNTDKKNLCEGLDFEALRKGEKDVKELENAFVSNVLKNFYNNMKLEDIDYKEFFSQCVDGFQDFEYEQSKIITSSDFWQILPADAAIKIAEEAYAYAMKKDEFTMGELNA